MKILRSRITRNGIEARYYVFKFNNKNEIHLVFDGNTKFWRATHCRYVNKFFMYSDFDETRAYSNEGPRKAIRNLRIGVKMKTDPAFREAYKRLNPNHGEELLGKLAELTDIILDDDDAMTKYLNQATKKLLKEIAE